MTSYKPHYACFTCRKTFKRKLLWDIKRDSKDFVEAKCPQCGELMADMGLDFESPKKDDIKQWKHIQNLYKVGITFHSCGCNGPGYIPENTEKLRVYFKEILEEYKQQLFFWRNRIEPTSIREAEREKSKNWNSISQVPLEHRSKKDVITNEEAIYYWIKRIKEVEQKLEIIKMSNTK
jgi:DNA-directed RNA polymerase subunit RPC12/RpoP